MMIMNIKNPQISQIPELKNIWQNAFGDSGEFINSFFNTAFCPQRCRCITENEKIISVLYWFNCYLNKQKIAYIYAVATVKEQQNKGYSSLLLKNTLNHLKQNRYAGAVLVPGSESLFDFYEKQGFKTACFITENEVMPQGQKITINKIDKNNFTAFRKQFLKSQDVIQEDENLNFLETQVDFYAGENFVMAANITDGVLNAAEFLGDTELIPQIVFTLGCKKGLIRTKGKGKPFAMFYPLAKIKSPKYFGLAFD